MTTRQKDLAQEDRKMEEEITRLEAERTELEAPAGLPTWQELQAGAVEDLEKRERRRGILPHLITAAKVRRLEVIRERYETELAPLLKRREEAYEKLQAATAKRLEAIEVENEARAAYGDANFRIESREGRIKETDREIRTLRGGA